MRIDEADARQEPGGRARRPRTAKPRIAEKVIVRSNGMVTYVGKDIANQFWKFGLLGIDPDNPTDRLRQVGCRGGKHSTLRRRHGLPRHQPRFEWIVDGECLPESSSEQTIRLTTLAPSQNHACQLHLRVYDSSTNRMAGEKSALISITKTAAVRSVTPPDVPPVLVPVPPDKQGSRAMLLVDAWPVIDPRADGAPIEGKVKGVEFKRHRVALYTWTGDGWSLQDMKPIDQTTGGWSGVAKFGSSYAALLVTDSFTPGTKIEEAAGSRWGNCSFAEVQLSAKEEHKGDVIMKNNDYRLQAAWSAS